LSIFQVGLHTKHILTKMWSGIDVFQNSVTRLTSSENWWTEKENR